MNDSNPTIQTVLDHLWHASTGLKMLSMYGEGPQAERFNEISGLLQALQMDVAEAASLPAHRVA
ncbi:hypothetical protein [Pollutimonas bauzanensis]|uniref:Uncharacterized protein n=1 Tax=Pollutimonas bauzanensis TaxID=658167 RepID=A0A1M5YHE8_9BURK|nr:hypothetical protein [Pollutimonas bauzanensis]SHI11416.1 hypothetical protein SAMN04488135_10991 [Pollutimonas bauzanensis]